MLRRICADYIFLGVAECGRVGVATNYYLYLGSRYFILFILVRIIQIAGLGSISVGLHIGFLIVGFINNKDADKMSCRLTFVSLHQIRGPALSVCPNRTNIFQQT